MNRRRMVLVTGTALAAGAATVGLVGYHDAAAGPAEPPAMLIASVPNTSIQYRPCDSCIIASTPTGAHIGGIEIDSGTLANKNGTIVGHYALQAVGVTPFTQSQPGELALHAMLVLGSDQILADGLEEPPDQGGTASVVGGTGRYSTARGTITYSDRPDGTTAIRLALTEDN